MKPYTVVFYVDAEYGVEGFMQEVHATDPDQASEKAVEKAKLDGGTTSGRTIRDHEWECTTTIAVLNGHGLSAYSSDRQAG